jgi:hypothetical protein
MNYTALADEINNDPENIGYSTHLPNDHRSVAELLNTDDPTGQFTYDPIDSGAASRIAAETGVRAALEENTGHTDQIVQSQVLSALDTIKKSQADFALQTQKMRNMLQNLVKNDVISTTQKEAFLSKSKRTLTRAEAVLGEGVTVTHMDVSKALN